MDVVYNALLPGSIADSYERENRDRVVSILIVSFWTVEGEELWTVEGEELALFSNYLACLRMWEIIRQIDLSTLW